ncbi:MAG: GolD/DthD family dehydrogenase [Janthinobacterium lividum]
MSDIISVEDGFDFHGQIVMVTGAASGIGLALARSFAARGARVVLLDRDLKVAEVARSLAPAGDADAHAWFVVDLTDSEALVRTVAAVDERFGRIDVLINNAGIARLAPAEAVELTDWDFHMALNLRAPFVLTQQVGRIMLRQRYGRIVSMASQAGIVALPNHLAYCVTKAGIINMTKVLALEWGPHGITANAISPTVVETELGRLIWAGAAGEAMKQLIPSRRFAQPQEIAMATLYLASKVAGMVNGENLVVDGGYTIQ